MWGSILQWPLQQSPKHEARVLVEAHKILSLRLLRLTRMRGLIFQWPLQLPRKCEDDKESLVLLGASWMLFLKLLWLMLLRLMIFELMLSMILTKMQGWSWSSISHRDGPNFVPKNIEAQKKWLSFSMVVGSVTSPMVSKLWGWQSIKSFCSDKPKVVPQNIKTKKKCEAQFISCCDLSKLYNKMSSSSSTIIGMQGIPILRLTLLNLTKTWGRQLGSISSLAY